MKQRHIFPKLLLVLVLVISICAASSCELLGIGNNQTNNNNQEAETYTVSFAAGADDAVGLTPASISAEEGSKITLPDNPFTREGYNFKGWSDGSKVYSAGAKYLVSASDVQFSAVWEPISTDAPELSELDESFYDAANWVYMTNNDGAALDGGDIPYTMADGSIKFHKVNQAFLAGDYTNATVSFMLKATNDFSIWFNSSTKDNANNSSYRLNYAYGQLRIALSSAPEQAAAVISEANYKKGEWNRFDVVFSTVDNVCQIKVYVNGVRAELSAGDNTTPMVSVDDNVLTHTQPAMFTTGEYIVVKVWEAHNYVQLKPVAKADEKDLPIIACVGASITEGAGATNFYTESYPAQLQNALGGVYNVINFGNSGKTVNPDLGDESWLNQYQWTGFKAVVPDVAILNIGTNDSKTFHNPTYDAFYEDFKNLVDSFLAVNPDMRIIVCTVPYAYSDIWEINNDNIANIIAPVQRDIAAEYGFELVDLYEYTQNKAHLFPDGVHPSTEGYEMIVKILSKVVLDGADSISDEFIADLNSKYSPKISGVQASIEIVGDKINLTVSGNTTIPAGGYLKLGVTPGETGGAKVDAVIDGGKFTATIDLATLRANEWFNVRIYTSDIANELVFLSNASGVEAGQKFIAGGAEVTVQTWDSNGNATLSFAIIDHIVASYTISVTGGSIVENGNEVILTVKGKTNAPGAKLLVGPKDDLNLYGHNIEIAADGSFSISFNLASLEISNEWQNVRLYMSDGANIVVPYDKLGLSTGDSFYTDTKKITVNTWGGEKIISLSVEKYEADYPLLVGGRVSASNMPFSLTQEGESVFLNFSGEYGGDKSVARTIELIVTLDDPAEVTSLEALTKIVCTSANTFVGESNTKFNFKVNITQDIGKQNGWMRFVLKVTEGDVVSYYTIKPYVPAHTGDWVPCDDAIVYGGIKYELAICLSSVFIQTVNP